MNGLRLWCRGAIQNIYIGVALNTMATEPCIIITDTHIWGTHTLHIYTHIHIYIYKYSGARPMKSLTFYGSRESALQREQK